MPIPYGRQSISEADIQAVDEVLRGDWLTQGPNVSGFEEAFAEACDAPYAVAFSSGTAALHGAAAALGLGSGDELVTSAITFAASANCAAYVGATPRFADIDRETWNVSPQTVRAAMSARTRAVVPVHFAGLPADIAAIRAEVGPDVAIVEDAAHAAGGHDGEAPIGSCRHSDMAIFSFHPVKSLTTAEGGMVTTRDPALRDALTLFRTHGITKDPAVLELADEGGWHQEQHSLGFNYRLSDVHAALGRSQLERLPEFVARRNAIASRYREQLAGHARIELPPEPARPDAVHARHLFVIRHADGASARRQLFEGLRARGILVQVHYLPVYRHPWYQRTYGYAPGLCPEAERYYDGCLSLPCFPDLTESEQDQVVAAIEELA